MEHPESKASPGVNLGLIITPMLDMSFQILAFFIMTYHPSALEGNIDGKLLPPRANAGPMKQSFDLLPPGDNLEIEDSVSVIVKAVPRGELDRKRADGEPSEILIQASEDATAKLIADSDENLETSLERLRKQLKRSLADGAAKGNLRLECQGDLKHQYVMRVYDVCKGAGFQNVAFVAPRSK